ncbi:(2Fe-2S) ferredoxin domain-containing protein [Candidatus Methylobacter oryzae]|uniref:(2Fe-2S) ferredoxin domain-containing protein n=1 Tax=Candidatus Methylobacter oryzae TaxID=2497749 RepID=A0ABY3C9W9_9GAMM|nr:(2Fe-2S) ferredoxin domain-containing protein [Candidatus Methylobacter oryzae]
MCKVTLLVCTHYRYSLNHPSCGARGGKELLQQLQAATEGDEINVEESCCFGHCAEGPVVKIAPNGRFYHHVTELDVSKIMSDAILLTAKL